MLLKKTFVFDAAHYLPSYKGKCERIHGHTYKATVAIEGSPDAEGMIVDFVELKEILWSKVFSQLDHRLLNDIIPVPSAENIALWLFKKVEEVLPSIRSNLKLKWVEVWETETSSVVVSSEDVG